MLELRRTKAGIFDESTLVNLYDFEKAVKEYKNGNERLLRKILIPAEIISEILPAIQANQESIKKLLTGKPIFQQDLTEKIPKDAIRIAVFISDRFIEVAKVINQGEILAKPEFVLN